MATYLEQYNRVSLVEQCTVDIEWDHLPLRKIWALDDLIRVEMDEAILRYQRGEVHSVEFYNILTNILNRPR